MTIVDLANHRNPEEGEGEVQAGNRYFMTMNETRRHGVVIGRAIQCGILTLGDFRAFMANCRTCRRSDTAPGADATIALTTPEWCANRSVLEGIRGLV